MIGVGPERRAHEETKRKLAATKARIAELERHSKEDAEAIKDLLALCDAKDTRIAELERLRRCATRRKTDAWDGTGQPAPTQADPDGYQKG